MTLNVPVERVSEQARRIRAGRTVLTAAAAVLYGLGWITARTLGAVWLALAWSATAVKLGWTEARARSVRR